ncbi:MAG: DUF2325 domain-containing protein [Acidobacteriota bacterium]|jgi:hypothetical protein|nr:DUF2325 domain-containing protein [Acidobacteriota bacterium]
MMPEATPPLSSTNVDEAPPRLRFWEIDSCFRCPVVGACLSHAEQRSLLKRSGARIADAAPYEVHEALVAAAGGENGLSRRIDTLLQRKYARDAAGLLNLPREAFAERFREALPSEGMEAALWAAAVRSDLGLELKREVFGELHMAMHAAIGERRQAAREAVRAGEGTEALRLELRQAAADKRTLQKELDACRRELEKSQGALAHSQSERLRLQGELDVRQRRDAEAEAAAGESLQWRAMFEDMRRRCEDASQYAALLEEENAGLSRQLERSRDSKARYDRAPFPSDPSGEAQGAYGEVAAATQCRECDDDCPVSDLCRKRILIVGGIERMESRYRKLIEGGGGVMEYHDGHVKKGARELECCLKRADMVLCPINCNSHAACLIIKKLGKKHGKPVCMLPNFSLSAVSRAIWNEDRSGAVN